MAQVIRSVFVRPAAIVLAVLLASGCATTSSGGSAEDTAPREPSVTTITPATGSLAGGETITLSGASLSEVSRVTFNGIEATDVAATGSTTVTAVVPRAVNYQPAAASVLVFAGDTPVPTPEPLSFGWEAVSPVDRQLQYALAHWSTDTYNLAEFSSFNPLGGDCANFVGQTLLARGWAQTDDWHNRDSGATYTQSWVYVPTFDEWLRDNADELGITELPFEKRDQVKVGDIVMFDWNHNDMLDHTQIVSEVSVVDGKSIIKMAGHNLDSDFRDLDTTITVDHPGATAYFWSIP